MTSCMLVTGFVPLEGQPRSPEEYQGLFEKLAETTRDLVLPVFFCQHDIDECWLFKYLEWTGLKPTHSVADNPKKNNPGYHIVQHQKLTWMRHAALEHPEIDTFAWVDMGIHSVPGITNKVIVDAIARAKNEKTIAVPGCWGRAQAKLVPDSQVNWRFCGGFFVVPRQYLMDFETAFRAETMRHLRETGNLSWEVNTLQRLEERSALRLPIWWYQADHNETLFNNYVGSGYAC